MREEEEEPHHLILLRITKIDCLLLHTGEPPASYYNDTTPPPPLPLLPTLHAASIGSTSTRTPLPPPQCCKIACQPIAEEAAFCCSSSGNPRHWQV